MSRFDRWLDLFSVVPSANPRPLFLLIQSSSLPLVPFPPLHPPLSALCFVFIYLFTIIISIIIIIIINHHHYHYHCHYRYH